MKSIRFTIAVALIALCAMLGFAQNPTQVTGGGRYGVVGWAVMNQRVASQYNYYVDSIQGSGLGNFQFPAIVCQQAISLGTKGYMNPFIATDTIKIVDINSANTETLAQTAATISGGYCTVNPTSPGSTHTSYQLRSGTCGLVPALTDLGTSGTVIVDQKFYDDGCDRTTILGTVVGAVAQSGNYIHDISNGHDDWYVGNGSAVSALFSIPGFAARVAAASPTTGLSAFTLTSGAGSAQSATTGNGGAGGAGSLTAGAGGASGSASGTGGAGGALTFTAGAGGGTVTGGAGGAVSIRAGAGGNGSSAGGSGGAVNLQAGAAGTGGTGTAGKVQIKDATDATKIAAFDVSNLTTGHTTTITVPEVNAALPIIPVMNHSATAVNAATLHIVRDTCVLGTSCAVTFTGAAVFADTNYVCTAQDVTSAAATKFVATSASVATFTGTGTDTLVYTCVGN